MKEVQTKRSIAVLMTIICALTLCFAIAGCGGDAKAKLIGTWEVTEMEDPTLGTIDATSLKSYGLEITLTLNNDGSAAFVLFGQSVDGTWEAKGADTLSLTLAGATSENFTLQGDKLVGEQNGSKLVFEKVKQ